jgi:chromosomal replication initiation ATPase DnaA
MRPSQLTEARSVIMTICRRFDITMNDLDGPDRPWHIAWPRMLAAYVLHEHVGLSGRFIGCLLNRDTSSVFKSISAVRNYAAQNQRCKEDLDAVSAGLAVLTPS